MKWAAAVTRWKVWWVCPVPKMSSPSSLAMRAK